MCPLKCFVASNCYGSYCVPFSSKHRPAAKAVLCGDVWERTTLAFLCANCGAGDIVHAGTYFGDFLPALSQAVRPDAHIWAFEPSAENFACANITLKLNDIRNVALSRAALGACTGTALLCTGKAGRRRDGGGSRIVPEVPSGFDCEEVPVVALDEALPHERRISIVQLDVEYYEQHALAGALSTIRRCRPLLVLENLPPDPDWFADNILSLGYAEIEMCDRNHVLRAGDGQT